VADELQPGDVVSGKLEVIRKIAGGGMGAVYEVEHKLTRHRRALKILHKSQALNRRHVERLLREASVAGRLDTPHVVETLDAGMLEDGTPYVLMELLQGRALLDLVENESPLDVVRTVRIIRQVCRGMMKAHDAGIIHRDLKPENIIVQEGPDGEEHVKIIDFGISHFRSQGEDGPVTRLTTEGTIIGTPYYMSPEQASGRDVDERTDVYALGVILYEALTGKLPFIAETTGALFIKIGTGEYLPLRHRRRDIDAGLAEIVERAFHREPDARFATARELSEALAPYADRSPGKEKVRRATADYESDPPRARTNPGVAPSSDSLETIDAESLTAAKSQPIAVRASSREDAQTEAIEKEEAKAGPRPVSRDAPTEALDAPASIPDAAESEPPESDEDDALSASVPPAKRMPQWLGTTTVAAVIAAVVAITIVSVGGFGRGDDSERPPVTSGQDELMPAVEVVEVVEPTPVEESEAESTPEEEEPAAVVTMEREESEDRGRPTMMRGPQMGTMQSPAEAAGLETDPYGP
jgi:serine/threonine-protein kinase